jgi:hypothetical protein
MRLKRSGFRNHRRQALLLQRRNLPNDLEADLPRVLVRPNQSLLVD